MKRLVKIVLVLAIFGILLATIAIAATTYNYEKTKSGQNIPAENAISSTKVPYSAIFGTIDRDGKKFPSGSYGEISNVSFKLPVDANVYVTSSGLMHGENATDTNLYFKIDGWAPDWEFNWFHRSPYYSPFEISQLYPKMKAGKHTISVWSDNFDEDTTFYNLIITVIVNQNGKITEKSTG
jgi:hypothetical protein